jgi:kynurenine formamidase
LTAQGNPSDVSYSDPVITQSRAQEAFARCSNAGRWGADDELGTLNLITPEKRRQAAALVVEGVSVSMGADIDTAQRPLNPRPARHIMHLETRLPYALHDSIALDIHGVGTHLDAVGHVFFDGVGYNDRRQDQIVTNDGLQQNSIHAMRSGIFTRAVLLDVAAAANIEWFERDRFVTPADLDAAEAVSGVHVEPGDAVIVHTGLERRAGSRDTGDLIDRAGLDLDSVFWLRERDVAVFSGDCVERLPISDPVLELPLHQVGIAAMGLCLLDWPRLTDLLDACARFQRADFLLTVAPLRLRGATGSPVNPIATF